MINLAILHYSEEQDLLKHIEFNIFSSMRMLYHVQSMVIVSALKHIPRGNIYRDDIIDTYTIK